MVEFPKRRNETMDFRGQILRAHISTPMLCPKKITPDFAMGGPPIYESFVRKVGQIQSRQKSVESIKIDYRRAAV